jgi:hypothetical protein
MQSSNLLKKCKKIKQKKLKAKTFACCNKSQKLHFSVTYSWITFFAQDFLQPFQRIQNQRQICSFIPILHLRIFYIYHISTFYKVWRQMQMKRLKKARKHFKSSKSNKKWPNRSQFNFIL